MDSNDPIYKTRDGQQVTHAQLLASGYNEDRIAKGLSGGILSQVGDTNSPTQVFNTKDGQSVTYNDLVGSGYSEDRINKGIQNGVLLAAEPDIKKKVGWLGMGSDSQGSGQNIADPTSQSNSGIDENDIIGQIQKANELSNKTISVDAGVSGEGIPLTSEQPDASAIEQSKQIKENLKTKGYKEEDQNSISKDFKDFPAEAFNLKLEDGSTPYSKENLLQLRKDNPIKYQSTIDNLKTTVALAKTGGVDAANQFNQLHKASDNFPEFNAKIKAQQGMINHYLTGDEQDKANQRLQQDASKFIDPTTNWFKNQYDSDTDLNGKVDINQYAGLKTLELFNPQRYQQVLKMLGVQITPEYTHQLPTEATQNIQSPVAISTSFDSPDSTGGKLSQKTIDQQIGQENINRMLGDMGRNNALVNLNKQQYDLNSAYDKTDDENEKANLKVQYVQNQNKIQQLKQGELSDTEKYPLTSKMQLDNLAKELTGQAEYSPLNYGAARFAKGFGNTQNTIEDKLTDWFGSNSDKTKLQIQRMGEQSGWQSEMYLPENLKGEGSDVIPKFSTPLQEAGKNIYNDKSIPADEKAQRLRDLIAGGIRNGEVNFITNPDAGKSKNFLSKSTLYSNAGMLGDIFSIAAQSAGLSGLGASKMVAAATPMFTTSYSDFYNQALQNGSPNPEGEAFIHASIMAAAGLINPDINIVKRSLGLNSQLGKVIAGVDEATWNKVINGNKPLLDKFKSSALSVGKEALKMGSVYGVGTSIAGDLADKGFFNKDISGEDMVNHAVNALVNTTKSSVALFGLNAITNFKDTPFEQKARIWELGDNTELAHGKIDEAVQNGQISEQKGEQQKQIVTDVSKLIEKVPTENAKGKPLTDRERIEYLYNSVIKNKATDLGKILPAPQKEDTDHAAAVADFKNDLIFDPKTDKQLDTRKAQLEKLLTPVVDKETGKTEELPEKEKKSYEAELEAVNDVIKVNASHTKMTEDQKLISQSIDNGEIKGANADQAKSAIKEGKTDDFLKAVADQALNKTGDTMFTPESAKESAERMYGKSIVEAAIQKFPNEEAKITEISNPSIQSSGTEKAIPEATLPAAEGEKVPPTDTNEPTGESGEQQGRVTGVKRAVSDELRANLGLPKVDLPKMGKDVENLNMAKERVDSGKSDPKALVNRILDDKGGYRNADEVFDMQYYAHQLGRQAEEFSRQIAETENQTEKAIITQKQQQLSDEMDRQTEAEQIAGNKWSAVGNAMQPVVDQEFNPSRERLFVKDAYMGEVPEEVKNKLDAALKEKSEALAQLAKVEESLKQKQAELEAERLKKGRTANGKKTAKEKRSSLFDDLKAAKEEHEKWMKDNGIQKSGVGFTLTGKMIQIIGKIAGTYIEEGAEKLSEVIDKVHDLIKDIFPGIEKKDVRDAIALHEAGKLDTKAKGLEEKIKSGEVKPSQSKLQIKIQNNSAWVKANQRVTNANFKIKTIKQAAFNSNKNMYQKILATGSKLVRFSVLSGVNVLYKLGSALAIGGAAKRIPEQAFGTIWSNIYRGIAKKAPIEGFPNVKSELKFYKEIGNPKKLIQNTWEIAKNHASKLDQQHGKIFYDDLAEMFMPGKPKTIGAKIGKSAINVGDRILTLPIDLHQMIKNPLKRAAYEGALSNAMIWAEKNELDITDPLIKNSLENAAFKRANYELFQEQNTKKFFGVSNPATALNNAKNKFDKSGGGGSTAKFLADYLVPVSTVPTNIAKRVLSTSPLGFLRGNILALDAYRKGIENLTNEQADGVMRQLKQGSLGTALWLIGWFASSHFGGLYSQFNPDKKRKEGELSHDQMEVNGTMLPKPVQHALPLEVIQLAATARHIYDNYKDNKKASTPEAIYNAGLGAIGALTEQIPILETGAHLMGAATNPYEAGKLKEDMKRSFQPQILKETGVIGSGKKTNGQFPQIQTPSLPEIKTPKLQTIEQ